MMKLGAVFVAVFLVSSMSYFKYRRQTDAATSAGQHYIVVDESIWNHARANLSDIRVFISQTELPYKLIVESGSLEREEKQIRVLQPAIVGGRTQFLLDMNGVSEYDRISLTLATKNFVAHARVEGQDDPHGSAWAVLGVTTLYDLSDEKLGRNSALQLPVSAYKYLRVTVDSGVKPSDVTSASAGVTHAQKAVWRVLDSAPVQAQQGRDTLLTFSVPANSPVERFVVDVDAAQKNFRREIYFQTDEHQSYPVGEVSRIHMERHGQKVDVEQNFVDLHTGSSGKISVIIRNGDDPPLRISGARLQQCERRIYFDSDAGVQPWIYYGDDKLPAPIYDYAKLFQEEKNANRIALKNEEQNSAYTGRPDDRPWSERHPALLWVAIVAAVLVLGALAVRSLKSSTPTPAS